MGGGGEMMERGSATVEEMESYKNLDEVDDDGKARRTGTVWTASAHIITAVIGSGVLSLGWAMAQLGWIAGPLVLFLFSIVTYYTSILLTDCYRTSDPVNGKRNYTYMDAVKSNLDATKYWLCGICQYVNLFGTAVGYTITASISAQAISKANCFHYEGHDANCKVSESMYMIGFGIAQVFLSQLPNFHDLWWLSIVAAIMSFVYSFIAIGLSIAKIISGNIESATSITGLEVGVDISAAGKVWTTFQALGDIAFAYSYSMILIEIQDTVRSPPAENKVMKKATLIGVSTTTTFYFLCGCLGYIAFGNKAPGNILTDFGFYEPYWLVDFANLCVVVHLVGAFQVYSQPLFAAFETWTARKYPDVKFLTHEIPLITSKRLKFKLNMFRLVWRTIFVVLCTVLAIVFPFFNDVVGFIGAVGFWPLTVYFPIEMYIQQKKIRKYSGKWISMQLLSIVCLLVTLAATIGSVEGVWDSLRSYKPFSE
ncbi:amino acid permease 4-like [Asparagus officinalis]|uniref:amino acid permease 4-like n=1 Tax=Asparagus officinalis TaxID=4686 RepID=UPI00098E41AE|nr:amino acid permease 4-like [Asparagus officinalis]